ncbi:GntR family transcriptional regulator [Marinobacterium litorale]|uniref:GntR family transcriptional regulator n=1 Tax=Marinobacterium litorale TaxID=404770 RepID=UPI000488D02A|nr:GntR family transcriptional regulator [Marinobacterium litorale]
MNMQLKKVKARPDFVSEVYESLLDAISDGSLAPGTRLTQEQIAEQLEVSRSPVLQALRLLKKDGFVTDAPGRGVLVAPLDLEWLSNLYDIRSALDQLAVRLAAEKKYRLDGRIFAEGRKAASSDDIKRMIDADIAFHYAIYEASGNPLIYQSAQPYWSHLRRVMGTVLQSSGRRNEIWDEHEAIAEAISTGEVDKAVNLTAKHAAHAKKGVLNQVRKLVSN